MKSRGTTFLAVAVSFAATLACSHDAHAIPAFSRQYKVDCKTCHTVFPERNEFGDAFAKNSFVWPRNLSTEEKERAKALYGDKATEILSLADIPTTLPVSFQAQHDITFSSQDQPELNLDGSTELEVFTAGAFRDKAGYWADYSFTGKEIGEVYLQFRRPLDMPLNVKVGKFKPQLSLWKSNNRATVSTFGFNKIKVDDDNFTISAEQGAVELNSVIGTRLFAATGVTNGFNKKTNGKDWYGHISARIGGTDFLGNEPDVDLDVDSIWDFLTLTVGSFGYVGSSNDSTNDFYRAGLETELIYRQLKVRIGGILGKDDNPKDSNSSEKSRSFLTQGQYLIGSNALAAFRYEYENIETLGIVRRYIPSLSYTPYQSVRIALEYTHEVKADATKRGATFRLTFAY